jgi:hypothetical protein
MGMGIPALPAPMFDFQNQNISSSILKPKSYKRCGRKGGSGIAYLEGMRKPLSSCEETAVPLPEAQPNLSFGRVRVQSLTTPTEREIILAHFNPHLIGFGIVGLSMHDSNRKEYSGKSVPAAFSTTNPGDQK